MSGTGGRASGRGKAQAPAKDVHDPDGVRLQKVLAAAGIASRRASEELIVAGRVTVDGVVVRELGVRVDPDKQVIHVDGDRVQTNPDLVTLAFHKPEGVLSTMSDPDGRETIADYVADRPERLFHVGRLDVDSEGLLLLTNDGELAQRLTHPSYEVPKTYLVDVIGQVPSGLGARLTRGVELEDGVVSVDAYRIVDMIPGQSLVEVVLHDGRNRVVRRLFEEVGFPVIRLVRTKVGPIRLGELKAGRMRVLSPAEVASLQRAVGR